MRLRCRRKSGLHCNAPSGGSELWRRETISARAGVFQSVVRPRHPPRRVHRFDRRIQLATLTCIRDNGAAEVADLAASPHSACAVYFGLRVVEAVLVTSYQRIERISR